MGRKEGGSVYKPAPKTTYTNEWYTPRFILDAIGLRFDLDPCSPGKHIVPWIPTEKHYTKRISGLKRKWFGIVWLNPPYDQLAIWLAKMDKHRDGIAFVFARTETKWFHAFVTNADMLCFFRKRIGCISSKDATLHAKGEETGYSTVASGQMLIAWGDTCCEALLNSDLGWCIDLRRK